MALTPQAEEILRKRYLRYVLDEGVTRQETPEELWRRVASVLSSCEQDKSQWYGPFRDLMATQRFLPNSPTLMNAGYEGTLSACFTFHVQDSLEHIFEVGTLASKVLKYGGGVGYGLSALRGKGSPIKSTGGKARGPLAAIGYYQSIAAFVEQGGKRDGAQMAILSVDHPDIRDFIHMKDKDPQRFNTFNISVAMTDAFMIEALSVRDQLPGNNKWALLQEIADSAWRTGDPGCYFIDTAERDNPTPQLGRLESTNPCGEVPLLHAEACNLGSINLAKYWIDGPDGYDREQLISDVEIAVRMLDNAITMNQFPDPVITEAVRRTRKIGLGVMGLADLFALIGIHYDTQRAVELSMELAHLIRHVADRTSAALGREKGRFPAGETMSLDSVPGIKYRNATRVCIAPTGTIANIAGCSTGIEPHYALEYTRTMGDGTEFLIREPVLDRTDFRPKTAMEIDWPWHVAHQAAWQKSTDLAVSKTINLRNDATPDDVLQSLLDAWKTGCKGWTVFRDGCRSEQVLRVTGAPGVSTLDAPISIENVYLVGPTRRKLPRDRNATVHKFEVDGVEGYIIAGLYEDGQLGEVFLNISKEGSTIRGWADLVSTQISVMLQHGISVELIADKLRHTRFEPAGITGNSAIPFVTSIPDYIGAWLEQFALGEPKSVPKSASVTGQVCPQCGGTVRRSEGCLSCSVCDWSRC